ncbi:MAG: hypothetical protein AAGG11_24615 [Pseudomonadota bacterium]
MQRPGTGKGAPSKAAQPQSRKGAAAKGAAKPPKKHKPPKLPSTLSALKREYRFDRALRAALRRKDGGAGDPELIQELLEGLGETSMTAADPFVTTALESALAADGPVLQCGANPLTMLLAIVMQRRNQYLWTLEHNPSWAQMLRSQLARYDLRAGQIIQAPAEAFGDHIFYVLDPRTLPGDIALVICDGSNVLPNGLRGVVRRLPKHLSHRCVLLVRNTRRPKDLDFAAKWARSVDAPFVLNDKGEPFVKIAMRDQTPDDDRISDRVLTVYDGLTEPEDLSTRRPGAGTAARRATKPQRAS